MVLEVSPAFFVLVVLERRTRVAALFSNEASLLRLASALLCQISDEWLTGKIYLNMKPADTPIT